MKRAYTLAFAVVALSFAIFSADTARAQNTTDGGYDKDDLVLWVLSVPDGYYLERVAPNHYAKNKQGNFAIAAGAHIRMVTSVDFAGIIDSPISKGFIVPYISNNPVGQSRSQVIFNPYASQFYVRGAGLLPNGRKVEGYLSLNFMGPNNSPDLHQAYIKMCNFTVGKAWNTISDINSAPPTVDYWQPSGFSGFRNMLIRYENNMSDRFSYGVGIEMPHVSAYYSANEHAIRQTMPDAAGYIQYCWGDEHESTVRLSALYRQMYYYNNIDISSESEDGYGVQLSGKAKLMPSVTAYYRAIAGYGISSYINDLSVVAVDMVPNNNYEGVLTNLGAYGWYFGLQYDINESMFVSATYSQSRIYARSSVTPNPDDYKYSQYVVANCFWKVAKDTHIALECLMGTKTNFDSSDHYAHRVNLLVQYSF